MPRIARTRSSSPGLSVTPTAAVAAYTKLEPELLALKPEDLAPLNVDISKAVSVVLGVLPRLQELRPLIVEQLPKHPVHFLDELQTYVFAVWYAQLVQATPTSEHELKALEHEGAQLREGLLVAAEALAHRDFLDKAHVAEIRKGRGHVDTANDLMALCSLFREHWDRVRARTAVEESEVARAGELGTKLLAALGTRSHHGGSDHGKPLDAADRLARAFTLLVQAYDSCQRAVTYLRWKEGDADTIAPSFAKQRAGRRRASAAEEGPSDAAAEEVNIEEPSGPGEAEGISSGAKLPSADAAATKGAAHNKPHPVL